VAPRVLPHVVEQKAVRVVFVAVAVVVDAVALRVVGGAAVDNFLHWTQQPLVKAGELGLVVLLAAHMAGGVRLLTIEFLAWHEWQKSLLAVAAGVTLAVGVAFALNLA